MKLIAETEPIRQEMEKTISSLSQRITSLERIFVDLKQEINDKTGHDLDKEFEDIKKVSIFSWKTREAFFHKNTEFLKGDSFLKGEWGEVNGVEVEVMK